MQTIVEVLARMNAQTDDPLLTELGERFSGEGKELSLVGGPVRDAFLGRIAPDLDFTSDADPDTTLSILKPIAKTSWDIGRKFGTIGAIVQGKQVEVTTYRTDQYSEDSRKPEVRYGTSLEEDLVRRDFTINAIALRLPTKVLVDPFDGLTDLLAGMIRTPAAPEKSFGDDPLRMMRAARFVSQLGFEIEPATFAAMRQMADRISIVSAERVHDELVKLLMGTHPVRGLEVLVESGLADHILPELPALKLETDEHHRHKDVYRHSLTVLEQAIALEDEPDLVLRLAALLHDIGKPATRKFEPGGSVSFLHHDIVGAKLARKRLHKLRFDKDTIAKVSRLVELHMRFYGYGEAGWSDSAVRRYVRDAGELLDRLHRLTRADVTTRNRRKAERLEFAHEDLERRIAQLREQEELAAVRPEIDGQQIMEILGIKPGPVVGRAYAFLLELRLDEGILGEEEVERRLRAWYEAHSTAS